MSVELGQKVKSYNNQKAYGFVECNETKEIYGKDILFTKAAMEGRKVRISEQISFRVVAAGIQFLERAEKIVILAQFHWPSKLDHVGGTVHFEMLPLTSKSRSYWWDCSEQKWIFLATRLVDLSILDSSTDPHNFDPKFRLL